jgi:cytochrome b561
MGSSVNHSIDSSVISDQRYNAVLRALHWLVLLAVVVAVLAIELQDMYAKGTPGRLFMRTTHYAAGCSVLVLMTIRLLARSVLPAPAAVAGAPWMQKSAHLAHIALYALMIAMPILGISSVLLAGKPIDLYGFVLVPPFQMDQALSRSLKNIHETGATFVYILVGIHAAAALWHQFVLRDNIFKRVL